MYRPTIAVTGILHGYQPNGASGESAVCSASINIRAVDGSVRQGFGNGCIGGTVRFTYII